MTHAAALTNLDYDRLLHDPLAAIPARPPRASTGGVTLSTKSEYQGIRIVQYRSSFPSCPTRSAVTAPGKSANVILKF